ncbi:hypothetical protein A2153_04530 [Candidatus Gottesmanbacteria bacterium RBG_16_38_7b]|uniref:Glycosyltransferase 2-like domain-containing protein n=2 Tax=Candidatus Gottesmaniibacteriota TaxID=1752720 RepID=A0A1F5YHS0_9BACT|nr:MAG: hypothetical protein A2153_04530 [Candidatus Gottesmanbacteria bacterium RBG_16_38_7b]OGG31006.1 MAG: hypothetical protein A3I51_06140 [Candidatus Gottesmanbacteria bacterium RIFCSPLOWO2_02_FULL_38_8]
MNNKVPLSTVILTRNEEDNIKRCLESVIWGDEIIVIDDNSSDKTLAIVRTFHQKNKKIKIFTRSLKGDYAAQRNFGLFKAKNKWVFFIDADEIISAQLKKEIIETLASQNKENINGYYLKRTDYFLGRRLKCGETADIRLIRLIKKGFGSWQGRVHEVYRSTGKLGRLQNPLHHYPHKNISSFLTKINSYSDIVAQYWIEQGRSSSYWQIIAYPLIKFINNYFIKMGFLDGVPGLIMAVMMSFHSFLVRSKVYLKKKK